MIVFLKLSPSFLAALWAYISNEGVFIVVMQQTFQRAVPTHRKRKGPDSERLKRHIHIDSSHKKITRLCLPWKSMVMIEGSLSDPAAAT